MPQLNSTAALLAFHEGREPSAYQDSLGYWTIGVGHLIDKTKGGTLPSHIIDALLEGDIAEVRHGLETSLPFYSTLDEVRKAVINDMAFNLGVSGLLKWPLFLGQVRDGLYEAAAKNMLSTKWAKQVKSRAGRLAEMMKTGQWPQTA